MLTIAQETGTLSPEMVATWLFYPFAALTVVSAWAIVVSQSIVRMAVYLLLTLGGVAGMYFMLNAELLAAVQLIVYVGGTLILIIFGVMLTSRNPFMQLKVKGWELTVGILIGVSLLALLLLAMVNTTLPPQAENLPATAGGPGQGGYGQVELVGRGLLTKYLVPFEVAAVLLLVVMIGAAFMARKRAGQE
jgi:NADH-quinone oxidoreductase subunit J